MLIGLLKSQSAGEKVLRLLIFMFFIAFASSLRLLILIGLILLLLILITRQNPLKMILLVLPFVFLMLLSIGLTYKFSGKIVGLETNFIIIIKIMLSALLLGFMTGKESPLHLVQGVTELGLPYPLNRILLLTFRYFHMIKQDIEISNMALKSRGFGQRNFITSLQIYGQWIGGFFLKTASHSEQVYLALKARGFEEDLNTSRLDNQVLIRNFLLVFSLLLVIFLDRSF